MELALDPAREVMLAHTMNGEDFPTEHGYPLRLICPGIIGVRSAKWVSQLIVSDEEADSAPQRRDYKIIKEMDMTKVDWSKHKPINFQVVDSAIASPWEGDAVSVGDKGYVDVSGWAHGSGSTGSQVTSV